jgi:tetratricopeptide (TPR) repeat protein
MRRILLALSLSLLSLALGENLSTLQTLIDQGHFRQAYHLGLQLGGAQGYVFAAEGANDYAYYLASADHKEAWYNRAAQAAQQAIHLDHQNAKAYFELAYAQGRLAQYRGILSSLGLAPAVRNELQEALKLDPHYAPAWVALALWNLELAQKGVGWLFGANIDQVIPDFEKAIALQPQRIIHRVEYAGALIRMGQRQKALEELQVALDLPARTAIDRYEQERARQLLQELKS